MRRFDKYLLFLIFVMLSSTIGFAQANPMFSVEVTDTIEQDNENTFIENSSTKNVITPDTFYEKSNSIFFKVYISNFIKRNNKRQVLLREYIVYQANKLMEQSSARAYMLILLFSFLYGIAHSLGPGHNKVIVFSYFIGENAKIKQGLLLGNITAFIHALSGLVTALIILYVLRQTTASNIDSSNAIAYVQRLSFIIISVIGIVLLISHIRNYRQNSKKGLTFSTSKQLWPMAIGLGIIPCPGTIILVIFLSISGLQAFAILAALFMAAGMATTISIIGIITILSKSFIIKLFDNNSVLFHKVQFAFAIIGSSLIIGLGLVFAL